MGGGGGGGIESVQVDGVLVLGRLKLQSSYTLKFCCFFNLS